MPANPKPPANNRPTFLFTDIVDSSKMANAFGHTAYVDQLQGPHDGVLREAIQTYQGYVDGTAGDSFFVAFDRAEDALDCARRMQEGLHKTPLTAIDTDGKRWALAVRIGVHTAEHEVVFDAQNGYRGQPDVNFAARVEAQAGAGQVLVSAETYRVAGNAAACKWRSWPDRWIKSFEDAPQTLYEFLWDGSESRGEPGLRWLPATFRAETDRYIPRPQLQEKILAQYRQPNDAGVQARMVTLVGYGGMGKTRLAVACALQAVGVFKDGVTFVPLADRQKSAQAVVEAIGAALGLEAPAKLENLLPALHEKFVLLVLDNYESVHGPEVQELLRDLLRETRHLRLLVTGREAVNLAPLEKQIEVEGLTPEQATELFVDRARRQRGRDAWTPRSESERQALRNILRDTDRIPLAIELVAAWMGLRSLRQIAEDLEKTPLPALPPGHESSDPSNRHRSLFRSLNYSYRLLNAPLQRGVTVLSLFADTFDASSATEACGLPDAQGVLDRLYEKSLLTRSEDADGQSRYAMLRPTRAYAADRFHSLPDAADLQIRYIAHYCQLALDNNDINDLKKQVVLEREWRNALAAADLAETAGDASSLSILSGSLGEFLMLRGWWSEREGLARRALEAARSAGDRQAEGRMLNNLGGVYYAQRQWQDAIDCFQQSLGVRREYGDRVGEGQTLNNLGAVYYLQGQWQEAIDYFEQDLAICREVGDRMGEGQTLGNLGVVYKAQGKWQEAIGCYQQSLVIVREYGDHVTEGKALDNLGCVYEAQGQWQEAVDCYNLSIGIKREYGDRVGEGGTVNNLGGVYQAQGKWQEAIDCFQKSLVICREYGDRVCEGRALMNLGVVYDAQGKWQEAIDCYEQDLAICREYRDRVGEGMTLMNLGNIYRAQGKWQEAIDCYQKSLVIRREYGDRVGEGMTLENMALLYAAQGDIAKALEWGQQALQVLETTQDRRAIEKARGLIAQWEETR